MSTMLRNRACSALLVKCKDCRYWLDLGKIGDCRRYPPSVSKGDGRAMVHSMTRRMDMCGEGREISPTNIGE